MFSLFGRKEKPDARRLRQGMPVRIPETTVRGPATSVADQRELARRTAEKIDQIESEMISGAPPETATLSATLPMTATHVPPNGHAHPVNGHGAAPRYAPAPSVAPGARDAGARPPEEALPPLEFSTSVVLGDTFAGLGGIHVATSALAPELEEAAILYANAQSQAAGATLKSAIDRGQLGAHARQAWLMLFDVLQALGARTEFDTLALEYAARFEQSPPPWPDGAPEPQPQATNGSAGTMVRFPARVDGTAKRQLEQARRAVLGQRPVTVDFAAIAELDPEGAALVCTLIEELARDGALLVVLGATRLFDVARATVEPGRRDASDSGWKLALAALRLLGEKDAFDDLSIEYCVTYEVSPPSWEPMPANVRTAAASEARTQPRVAHESRDVSSVNGGAFVLRGEIAGRMPEDLSALRGYAKGRGDVIVDCRGLRRLDFVAAGELLNEVVSLVSQSKTVLFAEPIPIVEALLVVMGIHEVVEIRRRKI